MHSIFNNLIEGFEFSGNLEQDAYRFLTHHNCLKTAQHCKCVADECRLLAKIFHINESSAVIAGTFHDISGVLTKDGWLETCSILGIEVLPEEAEYPTILHQKVSKVMAKDIFGVTDKDILSAIGCHTTLKAHASSLDMVLFIADKIQWDQAGIPPYLKEVQTGLKQSLRLGALVYIRYLLSDKSDLKVAHPWLLDAFKELSEKP